jgi:hypothetical protein
MKWYVSRTDYKSPPVPKMVPARPECSGSFRRAYGRADTQGFRIINPEEHGRQNSFCRNEFEKIPVIFVTIDV